MSLAPDGSPIYPAKEPMRWNCTAYDYEQAIRQGADMLYQHGGAPSVCSVPWSVFGEMLSCRSDTKVAFPAPGIFVQTAYGWVYVVADPRLNAGRTGWMRDAYTGDSVKLENLGG